MTKKAVIISFSAFAVLLILLIIDLNSFSIVLWQNGFSNNDVYQEVAIKNDSSINHYVLTANDNHIGILCMKQGVLGIWQKQDSSMISKSGYRNVCQWQMFRQRQYVLASHQLKQPKIRIHSMPVL